MIQEPLSRRARGRWHDILLAIGVEHPFLSGKHGPCPLCGGKDRWRFTNLNGAGWWICNQCGTGDGVELVMRLRKMDFKSAAQIIESVIGKARVEEPRDPLSDAEARTRQRALWQRGRPIMPNSAAGLYLASRGIVRSSFPVALRMVERPCMMMAEVVSADGAEMVNVHRTFLTFDGRKAAIESPRLMMRGKTPGGCAVRLAPIDHGMMGIAEGIENALSAEALFSIPTWAALFADNLAQFTVPDGVKHLIVFSDNDRNFHGQESAMHCARLNAARGIQVEVWIPPRPGSDWNDVLQGELEQQALARTRAEALHSGGTDE